MLTLASNDAAARRNCQSIQVPILFSTFSWILSWDFLRVSCSRRKLLAWLSHWAKEARKRGTTLIQTAGLDWDTSSVVVKYSSVKYKGGPVVIEYKYLGHWVQAVKYQVLWYPSTKSNSRVLSLTAEYQVLGYTRSSNCFTTICKITYSSP